MDLLAALLRRKFPVTFEDLAQEVPAYMDSGRGHDALMRMFERDKDELRDFGIPIRTETSSDGETHGYRLDRRDFYLPYLSVMAEEGHSQPRRVKGDFYRALTTLAFTPDELEVVTHAAARVAELGEKRLADDASSAIRKLTFDIPPSHDGTSTDDGVHLVRDEQVVDPVLFDTLCDALRTRKAVSFSYTAISRGTTERREVEGYGVFYLGGHWYLVGRDRARDALRNFRLSRMDDARQLTTPPRGPHYEPPENFDLREHARSRPSWELGDGAGMRAVVEFRSRTGAAMAAARLGEPLTEDQGGELPDQDHWPIQRSFSVRRIDSFARWLLSFGGDAVPLSPPVLVDELRRIARAALAVHSATPDDQDGIATDASDGGNTP